MNEIWRDIKDYENYYQVSNLGRVKSLSRIFIKKDGVRFKSSDKILKYNVAKNGYPYHVFSVINNRKTVKVHRLVAENFIPNLENKPQVNHKNGNKLDNNSLNLEWVTASENQSHAWKNNLFDRTKIRSHKLTIKQVKEIKKQFLKYKWGMIQKLRKKYNVTTETISRIRRNINWKLI